MTRRRFRKPTVTPSLFPFLAVLVCTMGALIVLLVMVVQQARAHASAAVQQEATARQAEQEERQRRLQKKEDFQWRREILEQQRGSLTDNLSQRRLELSHLEDHIRRLQETWENLRAEAAELEKLQHAESTNREETEAKLERLRHAIEAARRDLVAKQQEAASRPRTFAIIPYDGPHGTKRRPIYIECTESGIVLQPEGVVLTRADMDGPLGPGNPLDAALRTTREHWARHGANQQPGEPYPLLIVRPNGTVAYNYAREALKDWDDEFGYELVDNEMHLAYPPKDAALQEKLVETIEQARQRQSLLAAAMPSQFQSAGGVGFVATRHHGGFQPLGGGSGGFGSSGFDGDGQPTERESGADAASDLPASSSSTSSDSNNLVGEPTRFASSQNEGLQAGTTAGPGGSLSSLTQRGANWAVPKASAGATAYRIPVRVVCQHDRLVILPRPGEDARPTEVMAADPLSRSIDDFVKVLWKQIERWDAAPVGGYWQPVLEVYVHPGAEGRFTELQTLLKGSGIQVQRQAQ